MKNLLQHTFASDIDVDTNALRSTSLSSEDFNKIKDAELGGEIFGVNSKDVIEICAFTQDDELVGWKLVEQTPLYNLKNISYTDITGQQINTGISFLDSLYPKTQNGDVLISPRHELEQLGITEGEYKIKISYRNDIVGSFANPYKLEILEISNSRTEIKAVTQSFKNSTNPNQASLNFEYLNFLNKRVVVAHIFPKILQVLKNDIFLNELQTKEFSTKASDYNFYMELAKKSFSLSEYEVLRELDVIYLSIKDLYTNYIAGNYNEVFTKDTLYSDYISLVDITLSSFSRFLQEENEDLQVFYKYMLIQMFDKELLDSIFTKRFDNFLTNGMNFGNGVYVPFLKYDHYTDNKLSENSNDVILIKTLAPLDSEIDIGANFYISQNPYSDDIVKSIILRSVSDIGSNTFKLRGPDISTKVTADSTKKYTLRGEQDSLLDEDLTSAEEYFKRTNAEVSNLSIDYSEYKNFVKFSSARARLDNFVLKLTNISKVKIKINETARKISELEKNVSLGLVKQEDAQRSINILKNEDLSLYTKKINEIMQSFTPYDKFLYFESSENAWPRETSFNLFGFTKKNLLANGEYKLYASRKYDLDKVFLNQQNTEWRIVFEPLVSKWKLFNTTTDDFIYSTNQNLSSGFTSTDNNNSGFEGQSSGFNRILLEDEYKEGKAIFPPELIPTNLEDFKKTDGYAWYKNKAKDADLYDKYNDDSLRNSLPEFLVRTNENDQFTLFLSMIGEQFDILLVYIETMTDMSNSRNSMSKGIPNQLVWFVMNSFGVKFTGRKVDELTIGKKFEENRDVVWRRILNNLPHILKTSGTEESIRSLFKCYGIPEQLFTIREYGGVDYTTDSSSSSVDFKTSTYDYTLNFTENNQYIEIPIDTDKIKNDDLSLEFRLSVDEVFFQNIKGETIFDEEQSGTLPANYGSVVEISGLINEEDDYITGSENPRFYTKANDTSPHGKSYIPHKWKHEDDIMTISWKNFREGVSFSYPKLIQGTEPSFMTIYSDRAKNENKKSTLTKDASVGDKQIFISDDNLIKYKTGDILVIDKNSTTEEYIELVDLEFFELKNPLRYDHGVGSTIEDTVYDPIYTLAEIGASDVLNGELVRLTFGHDRYKYKSHDVDFKFDGSLSGKHFTISELKRFNLLSNRGFYPILQSNKNWEFGIYVNNKFKKNYGKFYLNFFNKDGTLLCPSINEKPIHFNFEKEYDVLLVKTGETDKNDAEIKILIKRVYDSVETFTAESSKLLSPYTSNSITNTSLLFFGNYFPQVWFRGGLDRLRIYGSEIDEERFISHINNNQGYDIENYLELEDTLLTKVNFDHPYKLFESPGVPGIIKNYSLDNTNKDIKAYEFVSTEYPYNFVGKLKSQLSKLPSFGARVFNNNKIRIENQELVSQLNPNARATIKSKNRHAVDSNYLGVYFSPTDIINQEIVKFFGEINLGNFIGSPDDTYKKIYKKLGSLQKIFFKNGFGKLDIQKYFNLIKSYIDPSLFENLEKIVPARTNLISGLLIEPSLLERSKIIPPRIESKTWIDIESDDIRDTKKISEILNVDLKLNTKNKNISKFANDRFYFNKKNTDYRLTHETEINAVKNKSKPTFNYNFSDPVVGGDISDTLQDIFAVNGIVEQNKKLYKVEKLDIEKKLGVQFNGRNINYDVFFNDGIEVLGFKNGLQPANGLYSFVFNGTSGLPVFTNQNRMWWVFYSSIKKRWIIATDGTIDGGKKLALGKRKFENYTWIGGNKIKNTNTNTPDWFSTGFQNSIESDNLPEKNMDYFGRVNFVSKYSRFIDCDAYLHGWIHAELLGVYKGELTERIFSEDGTFINKNSEYGVYTFSGEKKYVFLNGTFRGKLQNGWVGSDQIQQKNSNKVIRIVGYFDGKTYESCDNPYYTSGLINSIVSFDNRDKLIFDFRNFNSDEVRYVTKKFDGFNLVKIPNTLSKRDDLDFKFIGDFVIENKGISDIENIESGVFNSTHTYRTNNIFHSPYLYKIKISNLTKVRKNSVIDLVFLSKNINQFPSKSKVSVRIKDSLSYFFFKETSYIKHEIVSRGKNFKTNTIYTTDNSNNETSYKISNFITQLNNNIKFSNSQYGLDKLYSLISNKKDFCIVCVGEDIENFDFCFIVLLETENLVNVELNNQNFLQNTKIKKVERETSFEKTRMHQNRISHFIRMIEIIDGGFGYSGLEEIVIGGKKPTNWKSSWPQKLKLYKLFNIDNKSGKLIGIKHESFLISGINWLNDDTITFQDTPKLTIPLPDNSSRYSVKKQALTRIVSGEPDPHVEVDVNFKNFGDLQVGDTIGKSLQSANMYFNGMSRISYDTGVLHNKKIKIQTTDQKTSAREKSTQTILFTNDSLESFETYIDSRIKDIMRSDVCGGSQPISSDTYDIQILNFYDDRGDVDDEITFSKNRNLVNNFFIVLNENEENELNVDLNEKQQINKLSKINENRISSGYVKVSGFYGSVSSANGNYRYSNDIMFCENRNQSNTPIPIYTNENKEWILTFDEEDSKWKLRNLKNFYYIVSNTKYLQDGFTATQNNNEGFFSGKEIIIKDDFRVDKNGIVYDSEDRIVGNKFQEASVSVNNRFKIVPNKLLFELNKDLFSTYLVWKIRIKSLLNRNYIHEIPIVYINSDSSDKLFIDKYRNLENKLKTLTITQYQETSACNLNFQNAVNWKIKSKNTQTGDYSDIVSIKTQGRTFLEVINFSKDKINEIEGNYFYVDGVIANKNNFTFEYSKSDIIWKIKSYDKKISITYNKKYPICGIYKSTTKNIYGVCEYFQPDEKGNLGIRVKNFTDEYESANGNYYSVGYLETGELLFKNQESNWIFYKENTNESGWVLQDARRFAQYKIKLHSNVEQIGVYTNATENIKLFVNFGLQFYFQNTRPFLNTVADTLTLGNELGEMIIYNANGYEKENTSDLDFSTSIKVINAKKTSSYYQYIPCTANSTNSELYKSTNIETKNRLEITCLDNLDTFNYDFEITDLNNIKSRNVKYKLNLENITEGNAEFTTDDIFYTNRFSLDKQYKKGDVVFYRDLMWESSKDTPENRTVIPGVDFDTGFYWKIHSEIYTDVTSSFNVEVQKSSFKTIEVIEDHTFEWQQPFVEMFKSENQLKNGIHKTITCTANKLYEFKKEYQPYDLAYIGKTSDIHLHGRVKTHTQNRYTRNMGVSVNKTSTTINKSGYLCDKPSIVRTFKKSERKNEYKKDSFWFNLDKKQEILEIKETQYVKPDEEPIISFGFEKYDTVEEIILVVAGFSKENTLKANGVYEKINNSHNDMPVYKNTNDFYIYNEETCWILVSNPSFLSTDELKISDVEYITSDTTRIDNGFNGNFGSSESFVDQNANVEIVPKKIDERTPTPSPEKTPTPTPTLTPTNTDNEDDTNGTNETPTPTKTTHSVQTTPTPTKHPIVNNDMFLYEEGDVAITKQKYDLSKNTTGTLAKIKEDLASGGVVITDILSLEDIMQQEDILGKIPTSVKNFSIVVKNFSKLSLDGLDTQNVTEYGVDTKTTIGKDFFRSFYLSKNKLGMIHTYENQNQFAEYGYYIKSWVGDRNVMVKILNQVRPVDDLEASKGLPGLVRLSWTPSYNASYLRIERRSMNGDSWSVVEDKVSQTSAISGYEDTTLAIGDEASYRIVSVGLSGKESYSQTKSGWKLGIPTSVKNLTASYDTYHNKIILNWTDVTIKYNKADYYTIVRSSVNEFTGYDTYDVVATNLTETNFVDELVGVDLNDNDIFWYKVISNNEATKIMTIEEYKLKLNWSQSVAGKIKTI